MADSRKTIGIGAIRAKSAAPVGRQPFCETLRKDVGSIKTGLCLSWELRNVYHHHPESKTTKSPEANSGSIHPYGRHGNAVKTRKTISTIGILWPVKAIFEKRAATVEVNTSISPAKGQVYFRISLQMITLISKLQCCLKIQSCQ